MEMTIPNETLKEISSNHLHWLKKDCDGWEKMKADLRNADLSGADLRYADLRIADLSNADLRYADLRIADLSNANLSNADLRNADLSGADLRYADLRYADLSGADLSNADLSYANLSNADLSCAEIDNKLLDKFYPIACPEYGSFIAWKKANRCIVKLEVAEDAKRSSAFTRKCRCSKAKVLAIENIDGSESGLSEIRSDYNHEFIYKIGETVSVENFDEDRKNECAPGIHFFITRQEAVDY